MSGKCRITVGLHVNQKSPIVNQLCVIVYNVGFVLLDDPWTPKKNVVSKHLETNQPPPLTPYQIFSVVKFSTSDNTVLGF